MQRKMWRNVALSLFVSENIIKIYDKNIAI